jgi:hypothetical protein
MPRPLRLALTTAMVALVSLSAYAQAPNFFAQPFNYTDSNGMGTLTITPLNNDTTRSRFQPVSAVLVQNNVRSTGSGVYHYLGDDDPNLPPFVLLSFTLVDPQGNTRVYQGTLAALNGFGGSGTYWPVNSPQTPSQWQAQSIPPMPGPTPIVNSNPSLNQGWASRSFSEAIGGVYFATFNTQTTPQSTATWEGTLPAAGNYTVEVFLPRPRPGTTVPRTQSATYQIQLGGVANPATKQISQAVTTSQWVSLGSFSFTTTYRIVLTDATGEPAGTRSVVANAVRLTPVTASPTP